MGRPDPRQHGAITTELATLAIGNPLPMQQRAHRSEAATAGVELLGVLDSNARLDERLRRTDQVLQTPIFALGVSSSARPSAGRSVGV